MSVVCLFIPALEQDSRDSIIISGGSSFVQKSVLTSRLLI